MTTSTSADVRPAYRPYAVRVAAVRRLSPHFVRITLTGDDLDVFGTAGLDQRIKLILPFADGSITDFGQHDDRVIGEGTWYERWRALPDHARNPLRTYTIRRIDQTARQLEVDIVLHHDAGPAGAWGATATAGDELIVVGPDDRSEMRRIGLDWHPGTARRVLLAGDETAAPAICAIVETLDDAYDVDAFIEVPSRADRLALEAPASARVTWLTRGEREHGAALTDAVISWADRHGTLLGDTAAERRPQLDDIDVDRELLWDSPDDGEGEFYAWIAGESGVVKTLRRHLVTGRGVDRRRVAFMGYWRLGQSERQG